MIKYQNTTLMKILGIETSCDETGAAVIENGTKILSSVTATSAGIHARTGGVIPEDAARKQIQLIIPVITLALEESGLSNKDIDVIAITVGPGLIGSLLVGVETAKTLSYLWNKPLVPVNHLVGHIYANWLTTENLPKFPALVLVVSGGHTDLVLLKNHGKITYIGGTRDDAAGEAFDKTARLLGLPYPGGPNLSKLAQDFLDKNPKTKLDLFPRPMTKSQGSLMLTEDNFDWSFSGLKTAVLKTVSGLVENGSNLKLADYEIISNSPQVQNQKTKIAAEVQEAIVDSLVIKSLKAIDKYKPQSFLLAGGVAANSRLREKLRSGMVHQSMHHSGQLAHNLLHIPDIKLCTDNAAYIGACAHFNYKPVSWQKINANPELTITD